MKPSGRAMVATSAADMLTGAAHGAARRPRGPLRRDGRSAHRRSPVKRGRAARAGRRGTGAGASSAEDEGEQARLEHGHRALPARIEQDDMMRPEVEAF